MSEKLEEKQGYEAPPAGKSEEELEAELQAKMNELNGTSETDDDLELDEETLKDDPADETDESDDPTPDEDDPADETDDDDDPTPDEDDEKTDDDKGDEVEIPDSHYRAAIHQGWTDEEIKELIALNPEKAKATFAKFHETTNKLTQEFARIGRAEIKSTNTNKGDEEKPDTGVDIEALRKEHGEDNPLVDAVAKLSEELAEIKQTQVAQPQPADDTLRQTVDTFFGSDSMKSYNEHYGAGTDPKKWTQEQYDHRWKVLTTADEIYVGAESQGRKMELSEALEMAHMLHSADVKEQVIRKEITSKVVKRSKGLSLKPKSSKKVESSKPKTEADLIAKTAERLKILK